MLCLCLEGVLIKCVAEIGMEVVEELSGLQFHGAYIPSL